MGHPISRTLSPGELLAVGFWEGLEQWFISKTLSTWSTKASSPRNCFSKITELGDWTPPHFDQ